MKTIKLNKYQYELFLLVSIVIFVWFKFPYLDLPFYWDEAWVYAPAVQTMVENGPGLLPDALPVHYSRGHPLFFHFVGSIWGVLFGGGKFSLHVFAMAISVGLIVATYLLAKDILGKKVAFLCSFVLCLQPIFLAQSGLVLPEVALALFTLLTIYFYFKKKWFWYFVLCSATILVKESGLVLLLATVAHYKLTHLNLLKTEPIKFVKHAFFLAGPILPWVVFLIIQKQQNGWYFFPDHVDLVSFDFGTILNKFENYAAYVFIYQERKFLLLVAILTLIVALVRKHKIEAWDKHLFFVIFIIGFLMFSSLNFFSNRYVMSLIVPVIILTLGLCQRYIEKWYVLIGAMLLFGGVFYAANNDLNSSDHNLGYRNAVLCHEEIITYCIEKELYDKHIYTGFLSREAMTNPKSSYLKNGRTFYAVTNDFNENTAYCIFANFDMDESDVGVRDKLQFATLVKRVEIKQAWAEIYKIEIVK